MLWHLRGLHLANTVEGFMKANLFDFKKFTDKFVYTVSLLWCLLRHDILVVNWGILKDVLVGCWCVWPLYGEVQLRHNEATEVWIRLHLLLNRHHRARLVSKNFIWVIFINYLVDVFIIVVVLIHPLENSHTQLLGWIGVIARGDVLDSTGSSRHQTVFAV